jgi:mannose-1-phosphate guanylyltransferase / phosphomannomutase
MKAVILAGGLGTRLRPLTYTMPKSMVLLGNKPLIHLTAAKAANAGFDQIIITTNFMAKTIADYFQRVELGVPVLCVEEKTAMGTAGCVKNLESLLTETFAVLPGDSITDLELRAMIDFHKTQKGAATLALIAVDSTSEFGIVQLDSAARILRFQEKPKPDESFSNLANTGYYVLEPSVLNFIPYGEPFDFSFGLFPRLLEAKLPMYGYLTDRFWVDVGRVEKYIAGSKWFLANSSSQIAASAQLEEGLPPNTHIAVGEGGIIRESARVSNGTTLGDRVTVNAGADISGSIVYSDSVIGSGCKISDSVIGEEVELQDGVAIEKNTIIGKGCHIGAKATVKANSRLGPFFDVPSMSTIEGVASAFVEKGNMLQLHMERNPELSRLNRHEVKIFGLLAEFGEFPAKSLSDLSKIPYSRIHSLLFGLQTQGLVIAYGETQKLFALRYEYPTRLSI